MHRLLSLTGLLAVCLGGAQAQVVFETPGFSLTVGQEGRWRSVLEKGTGRECLAAEGDLAVATVRVEGKQYSATGTTGGEGRLEVLFAGNGGPDTRLRYAVACAADWVVFRLDEIEGARPETVTLRLPVAIAGNVGPRLNIAWDEETCVCLMAADRRVDCAARRGEPVVLTASAQDAPGPTLEGAAAAVILCPTPRFKSVAREASHGFGLPTNEDAAGTPVKDTDLVRGSYWFLSFGEDEVERVIDYCERAGIRQVMLSFSAWCRTAGHYLFNEGRYPNGREGLKAVVDRLHEHGIMVGMHTFVSKVSKTDPYVTPVPDRRFWKDRETTLASAITAEETEIAAGGDLSQWPGSPVAGQKTWEGGVDKHREVIIGDEIVKYASIGPEGKWDTFEGCQRGAWGTTAAAHRAGAVAYHYGVDGCINGYIIDQETDLQDEVAGRIADIFNYCGFDMVYFDGGEDVDRGRFSYYVSNFQEQAMRRFARRPILHMGTIMTHLLWHSFARSSTVDTYLNTLHGAIISGAPVDKWPTVKEHIDRSVSYMLSVGQDMMPGELGWFGIWPRGENTDGLQLDEAEYLMCRSLAYDAPISLQTGFGQMEAHPLTPGILEIVREYEELRLSGAVAQEELAPLREPGRDFALIRRDKQGRFVPVVPIGPVGGTTDVRALVGELDGGSVATIWHYLSEGQVLLPLPAGKVRVVDLRGEPVVCAEKQGRALVPVGSRRHTLICPEVPAAELRAALEQAEVTAREPVRLFTAAAAAAGVVGEVALGSQVGITEPEALGDVLVCTARPSPAGAADWYARYTVEVPHAGIWYLWARVRYPGGGDDSFGLVRPGEPVTLSGPQVLGNCGLNERRWHWTGRGAGSTTPPPGQPICLKLSEGPFEFRIYAREGPGTAALNPRLDVLCLTDDSTYVPTDADAAAALGPTEGR